MGRHGFPWPSATQALGGSLHRALSDSRQQHQFRKQQSPRPVINKAFHANCTQMSLKDMLDTGALL